MLRMSRSPKALGVLAALGAMLLSATPSFAGPTLLITDSNGFNQSFALVQTSATSPYWVLPGGSSSTVSISGFTLSNVRALVTGDPQPVALSATLKGSATAVKDTITFNLFNTFTPSKTSTTNYLSDALKGSFTGTNNGVFVSSRAILQRVPKGASGFSTTDIKANGGSSSPSSFDVASDVTKIHGVLTKYTLSSTTSIAINSNANAVNTNVSFTQTAAVALPEPTGVVAGIAGLPFMLGLVGMLRRRLTGGASIETSVAA